MSVNLTLPTSLHFVVAMTALMVATILWWYPNVAEGHQRPKRILAAAFMLLFGWHMTEFLFSEWQDLLLVSFVIILFKVFFMPLNFLYFNSLVYAPKFTKSDLIHLFLPIVILVIFGYSYSRSPAFSIGLIMVLVHLQISIYWFLEVNLMTKLLALDRKRMIHINTHWLRWTMGFLAVQTLLFLPFFLFRFLAIPENVWLDLEVIEAFCSLLLCLSLFFQPFLLFGIRDIRPKDFSEKSHFNVTAKLLSPTDKHPLPQYDKLEKYVHKHHPYLLSEITASQLAQEAGVSLQTVNDYMESKNLHFQDYINLKRIMYSQHIIKEKAYHDMTMDLLAKQSGFMDRKSFVHSFKKHTGYNPSDYIKHFF